MTILTYYGLRFNKNLDLIDFWILLKLSVDALSKNILTCFQGKYGCGLSIFN